MQNLFKKAGEKPFLTLCIVIIILYLATAGTFIALTFTYDPPRKLKTATGTIADFKYEKDLDVVDHMVGSGTYLYVTLDDGSFFKTSGISFNLLNKELLDELAKEQEITVTYHDKGYFSNDVIYGIDYREKKYLDPQAVIDKMKEESKTAHILFPCLIGVATVIAGGLIFLCYVKIKRKKLKNETKEN